MEWNTIVVLSTVGTFFTCVGIFAFVARLERRHAARANPEVASARALAMPSADDGNHDELAREDFDLGDASEQANDARLGLPLGWTKMLGCWASPADDQK